MGVEGTIEYEQFSTVTLKAGRVIDCLYHENADKLLVLRIDVGEEQPRTICAGLKGHYQIEDLIGKTLIVVTNLSPRMMRGVQSQGMILAATNETTGSVQVATIDGASVPAGSVIK